MDMPLEMFFWIVAICGLIYAGLSQFIRGKLIDMDRMKYLQKEINKLNKEYFAAMKKQETKKMDEIKAKQDVVMPEFNGMMFGQLKVMGVIIVVFMSFMWVLGTIDPHLEDDIIVELVNQGDEWCGEVPLAGGNLGPWYVDVKAFEQDAQKSENGTYVYHGVDGATFLPDRKTTGEPMNVYTSKDSYSENEVAVVCATPPAYTTSVVATANSGTWFHLKLPFEIPILNTRTLNGVNIWFILVAIIGGIGLTRVKNLVIKDKKKEDKGENHEQPKE